jgi:hypothetical protein
MKSRRFITDENLRDRLADFLIISEKAQASGVSLIDCDNLPSHNDGLQGLDTVTTDAKCYNAFAEALWQHVYNAIVRDISVFAQDPCSVQYAQDMCILDEDAWADKHLLLAAQANTCDQLKIFSIAQNSSDSNYFGPQYVILPETAKNIPGADRPKMQRLIACLYQHNHDRIVSLPINSTLGFLEKMHELMAVTYVPKVNMQQLDRYQIAEDTNGGKFSCEAALEVEWFQRVDGSKMGWVSGLKWGSELEWLRQEDDILEGEEPMNRWTVIVPCFPNTLGRPGCRRIISVVYPSPAINPLYYWVWRGLPADLRMELQRLGLAEEGPDWVVLHDHLQISYEFHRSVEYPIRLNFERFTYNKYNAYALLCRPIGKGTYLKCLCPCDEDGGNIHSCRFPNGYLLRNWPYMIEVQKRMEMRKIRKTWRLKYPWKDFSLVRGNPFYQFELSGRPGAVLSAYFLCVSFHSESKPRFNVFFHIFSPEPIEHPGYYIQDTSWQGAP